MGIYGALSSAVTGLRAQSHALENISGNIANSQTTGYKRIETSFVDLIPDAPLKSQVPGAVLAQSRSTNNIQGDIQTSSNETFIALNTNGFFVVEPKIGQSDGNSVFAGSNYYTRRGDFEIDKDGLLVNGAGYYLKGLPIDPGTGNISGSVPGVIKLSNAFLAANVTKTINYQANLPQLPKTGDYKPTVPNSELLQPWMYSNVGGAPAVPTFTGATIPGGSLTTMPARAGGDTFVGTAPASSVINDGDLLDVTIGATTYNLEFDTNGAASGPGTAINANGDIASTLASMEAQLRTLSGNNNLTVKLRNGKMEVFAGVGSADPLSFATTRAPGSATGGVFGLGSGPFAATPITSANAASMPADLIVSNGQTLSVSVGGTTRNYRFDTDGTVTPSAGEVEINAGGSLEQMLASIEADLKANGGVGATNAKVRYEGGAVRLELSGNHYFAATISGSATGLGLNNTKGANPGTIGNIAASDANKFIAQSIEGGAITAYASNGAPVNVQLRWAKVDSAATGGADTWNLFYLSDSTAKGASTAWTNTGMKYEFDGNGSLANTDGTSNLISNLSVNGVQIGPVELKHDAGGVSQFADVNGTASVSRLSQNGYGAGEFLSVAITDSGRVVATYSNGERIDMAQVVTAQFNGVNSLKRMDGGVYEATSESGEPIFDLSGSGILGGALEASNTDISDEFTKLIITQQAYSAGTRIVSTADEMLQEALNMVR